MRIIAPSIKTASVKEKARALAELEYHFNLGNMSIGEYLRLGTQIRYGRN
jgi:hypothetical protein